MFKLFSKKSKSSDPPLPDELPPMPDNSLMPPAPESQDNAGPPDFPPLPQQFPNAPDQDSSLPEMPPLPNQKSSLPEMPPLPYQKSSLPEMPPLPKQKSSALKRLSKAEQKSAIKMQPSQKPSALEKTENVHDLIPDDLGVNEEVDLSPEKLPSVEIQANIPEFPHPEDTETIPDHVDMKNLPPLPNLPNIRDMEAEAPAPSIEDEVPKPPAIFSEDSFYETPEEIRHLVEEKSREVMSNKYGLHKISESKYSDEPVEKPEIIPSTGPIFVDVESFKTMLGDIETIRNNIKTSNDILQHLNEIKNSKDSELERWKSSLEDIQKKLNYVDKIVFKEA